MGTAAVYTPGICIKSICAHNQLLLLMIRINVFVLFLCLFTSCKEDKKLYIKNLHVRGPHFVNWYVNSTIGGYTGDFIELRDTITQKSYHIALCSGLTDIYIQNDTLFFLAFPWGYTAANGKGEWVCEDRPCRMDNLWPLAKIGLNHKVVLVDYEAGSMMQRLSIIRKIDRDTCWKMHFINTDPTLKDIDDSRRWWQEVKEKQRLNNK